MKKGFMPNIAPAGGSVKKIIVGLAFLCALGTSAAFAIPDDPIDDCDSCEECTQLASEGTRDKAERFSVYAEFGLTYDIAEDLCYFEGDPVRVFFDIVDERSGDCRWIKRSEGTVDLRAVRNGKNELVDVVPATQYDFNRLYRLTGINLARRDDSRRTGARGAGRDDRRDERENILTGEMIAENARKCQAYVKFGLTYDTANDAYYYKGDTVRFFVDEINIPKTGKEKGAHTYYFIIKPVGTASLRAVRDATGEMTGIEPVDPQDYARMFGGESKPGEETKSPK